MNNLEEKRNAILNKLLINSAFDGWSNRTLFASAKQEGISKSELTAIFADGVGNAINFLFDEHLKEIRKESRKIKKLASEGVSKKITILIILSLSLLRNQKEAVRRLVYYYSLPINLLEGTKLLYKIADDIWVIVGDKSADLNYFSKRIILAKIYLLTILYWIEDNSRDMSRTENFLIKRIKQLGILPQLKTKIAKFIKNLPNHVYN